MYGLIFALFLGVVACFLQGTRLESAYADSTDFLFSWYVFWSAVIGILVAILAVVAAMGVVAATGSHVGRLRLDKFVRTFVEGAFSAGIVTGMALFTFACRAALYIGGAWLLATADDGARSFAQFSTPRLVIGFVMILVGILWDKSSESSKSSSD